MNIIRGIITIVTLMFFIPISRYVIEKLIEVIKKYKSFISDIILYVEKLAFNKVKRRK
ncbi:hypothetical protein CLOHAE12215_00512 [Clostridium haemolyticum]|uniref:hypothetical protein n=1 Tax=Clostridium TaxID=1485 RepID=UPI000AC846C7|nr:MULTISPECIES: hypothetical protein [Clostridium]CAG7839108.1 hypothetical protein CLOHAE12215_00512 [Clostridium haemolyticum]